MPTTYTPIATTTLGSAAANIEFTSIPGTYTDLKLIIVGSSTSAVAYMTFNNDTATNYSDTYLSGNGTAASSARETGNASVAIAPFWSSSTTVFGFIEVDIFSYAGSTNKTLLASASNDRNGSGYAVRTVGLWRSTSAITSLKIIPTGVSDNLNSGTTATLYGIKKA